MPKSVWDREGVFEIALSRYREDFQTLVYDYAREIDTHAVIKVRSYDDFKASAAEQGPDWQRYWYDGVEELIRQKKIPPRTVDPSAYGYSYAQVTELGFEIYIRKIADAIESGEDVPPIVSFKGRPVDGRHRTIAAVQLGRTEVPVLEIEEMFPG